MTMIEAPISDSRILIVDDNLGNLTLAVRLLEFGGYPNIRAVTNGGDAMNEFVSYRPDLVILDLHLPDIDGFEVLRRFQSVQQGELFVPVLVFTGDTSTSAKKRALELGACDFLTKPGDAMEILLRVRNFLQLRAYHVALKGQNEVLDERVSERTKELTRSQRQALQMLARAGEYRDDDTGQHTKRVGNMTAEVAIRLGMPSQTVEMLRLAAPLHDVGKIGIPDAILRKPGKLTAEEFDVIKTHTLIGGEILEGSGSTMLDLARVIALHHHERWDGTGYPAGLAGEDIPLNARIVCITDAFDAMTSDRAYRVAAPTTVAVEELQRHKGAQFDPSIVDVFVQAVAETNFENGHSAGR